VTDLLWSCFLYRDIPSLESLHKVFGWGLSGDGPYYRVQQGAAEQSEQSAETAGPAGDRGQPAADTVGHQQNKMSPTHMYLHSSLWPYSFLIIPLLNFIHINIFHCWSPMDSTLWLYIIVIFSLKHYAALVLIIACSM